ncbi:MAG: autotransporter outer membrane beta-barrel domain-containing protein [Spongiibacteraceae bacterium]
MNNLFNKTMKLSATFIAAFAVMPAAYAQSDLPAENCGQSEFDQSFGSAECHNQSGETSSNQLLDFSLGLGQRIAGQRRSLMHLEGEVAGGGASSDGDSNIANTGRFSLLVFDEYSSSDRDNTAVGQGYEQSSNALTVGGDYRLDSTLFIGATISASAGESDFDNNAGRHETDALILAAHAAKFWGPLSLDAVVSGGSFDLDIARFDGFDNYTASTSGDYVSADMSVAYGINRGAWNITPLARMLILDGEVDAYRESSQSGAGLIKDLRKESFESQLFALSLQADYVLTQNWGVLIPSFKLEWQQEFADASQTTGQILNDSDKSFVSAVSQSSDDPESSSFNATLGASAQFAHGWSGFLVSEVLLGHDYLSKSNIVLGLRYEMP